MKNAVVVGISMQLIIGAKFFCVLPLVVFFPKHVIAKFLYAVFAESVWLVVGALVGFFGVFFPSQYRQKHIPALSMIPILTVPACAVLSATVAVFFLRASFTTRVTVCGSFNGVMFLGMTLFVLVTTSE